MAIIAAQVEESRTVYDRATAPFVGFGTGKNTPKVGPIGGGDRVPPDLGPGLHGETGSKKITKPRSISAVPPGQRVRYRSGGRAAVNFSAVIGSLTIERILRLVWANALRSISPLAQL